MKRNGMQIGGNGIENLLVTIALNFWNFFFKTINSKRHISIPLYLRMAKHNSNLELSSKRMAYEK
jgi:hypothetical protein